MKVKIDPSACIGCGLCSEICPKIFAMQDDKAVVLIHSVPQEIQETCQNAEKQCPANAISIESYAKDL